jgi:hypothetical protein
VSVFWKSLVRVAKLAFWMTLPSIATCAQDVADASECRSVGPPVFLPGQLRETSGVAFGMRNADLVWTHNDGRDPVLFAVDHDGRVRARVDLKQRFRDWEDIARGTCDLGGCLYLADTGDNDERRESVGFFRLAEPSGEADSEAEAEWFGVTLPDGARDIEAMYVLPTEQIFFVTKGRNHPVTLYHYPSPLRSDEVVRLVEIQRLTPGPTSFRGMVTGASASLDGSAVVIRTYQSLEFFDVTDGGRLLEREDEHVSLRTLGESQGEGVGFGEDRAIVLSSEGAGGSSPSMIFLTCGAAS